MFSFAKISYIFAFNNKGKGANHKDLLRISFCSRLFVCINALNPNRNQSKCINKFYTMGKIWLHITEQISKNNYHNLNECLFVLKIMLFKCYPKKNIFLKLDNRELKFWIILKLHFINVIKFYWCFLIWGYS